MLKHENEKPPEREFLKKRHKVKTGEILMMSVASDTEMLLEERKEDYLSAPDTDVPVTYEKVVKKGEMYTSDCEHTQNHVQFNQQVDEEDLAELRKKCSLKQFVEVVRYLPEYNFSTTDTFTFVKGKSKVSPCFECGVPGCLRQQERWQARVLHGCYPKDSLTQFQHDRTNRCASCYFVNAKEMTLTSDKYLDVMSDFEDIDHHRTGKERQRKFQKKKYTKSSAKKIEETTDTGEGENGENGTKINV